MGKGNGSLLILLYLPAAQHDRPLYFVEVDQKHGGNQVFFFKKKYKHQVEMLIFFINSLLYYFMNVIEFLTNSRESPQHHDITSNFCWKSIRQWLHTSPPFPLFFSHQPLMCPLINGTWEVFCHNGRLTHLVVSVMLEKVNRNCKSP